jgi:anti-sigma factor RsiW
MFFRRRRRALVCRDAVALMTDYLDGALAPSDRDRLEAHLATCPHCSEYLAQIRVTIVAAGRVEPDDLPEEALDDLVSLYRRWRET